MMARALDPLFCFIKWSICKISWDGWGDFHGKCDFSVIRFLKQVIVAKQNEHIFTINTIYFFRLKANSKSQESLTEITPGCIPDYLCTLIPFPCLEEDISDIINAW